jgi:hypothetical protein
VATNDYIAYATGGGAQVLPQSTYVADGNTLNGRPAGVWDALHYNKTARQAAFGPACLGNLINSALNVNANDDGNAATYTTNLTNLINALNGLTTQLSPQGRLTLTTGVPLISADVNSATSVFYTAYNGNIIPIWNGSILNPMVFASDLSLALTAGIATASGLYDVFAFNNSGSLQIGIGPVWTTVTAGSSARGSGAGTTQISRLSNGLWVNTVSITLHNGATSFGPISASFATYLGSLYIDTVAGQISCNVSYGQNRKWGVWNAYNRLKIILQMGDSTASWSASTASGVFRAINNNTANNIQTFTGLQIEPIPFSFDYTFSCNIIAASSNIPAFALGFNSTTIPDINTGIGPGLPLTGVAPALKVVMTDTESVLQTSFGLNQITALESQEGGSGNAFTAFGTINNCKATAEYRA